MKSVISLIVTVLVFCSSSNATTVDEGMWLPLLIKDLNYDEMKRQGCTLTPEQIYSANKSSLKDAVVQMRGCTGEVISNEGLVMSNHHCAISDIIEAGGKENDYLKDGFWAKNMSEEIKLSGQSMTFLVRMEDVTNRIMAKAKSADDYSAESLGINEEIGAIEEEVPDGEEHYQRRVKPMFNGNAYYLFVYETFNDIRLVGTPPSSIGQFGAPDDNWKWSRYTGDFALFRIYADKDNKPARYSSDNVVYKPKHSLPISLKGAKVGQFNMVLGYPVSTDRYISSTAFNKYNYDLPIFVKIFEARMAIMKAEMDKDNTVKEKLISDYESLVNVNNYYSGSEVGFKRVDVLAEKKEFEKELANWIESSEERKKMYGTLLKDLKECYLEARTTLVASDYLNLAGLAPQLTIFGIQVYRLHRAMQGADSPADYKYNISKVREAMLEYFENFEPVTDQKILTRTCQLIYEEVAANKHPNIFANKLYLKSKGDSYAEKVEALSATIYKKSILANEDLLNSFLAKPSLKKLESDPGFQYVLSMISWLRNDIRVPKNVFEKKDTEYHRLYYKAMLEMRSDHVFYPDADYTMRLSYGTVEGFTDWNNNKRPPFAYASELLKKEVQGKKNHVLPAKLKKMIQNKDYGKYATDGKLPVCFINNADITGGFSGAPVVNEKGELVGLTFDANEESMISDIKYQKEYARAINVDIRYVLFIIDKFAGAGYLLDEMKLVE
jgi:hypothetical protein